ncbi:hypothetical protein CSOJ01_03527 [Colletotrichum sojae]|uniref:Uncharacterized protein n=1 Tax=Colletotrichum sojae TaxID=2175907 RepID=A0A8H6JLJ7_9PEZI|nr:hypothetical protein CSOJ01_03527 [Colletotrichum sojae]
MMHGLRPSRRSREIEIELQPFVNGRGRGPEEMRSAGGTAKGSPLLMCRTLQQFKSSKNSMPIPPLVGGGCRAHAAIQQWSSRSASGFPTQANVVTVARAVNGLQSLQRCGRGGISGLAGN